MNIKITFDDIESSEEYIITKIIKAIWYDGYSEQGDFCTLEEAIADTELRSWAYDQLRRSFHAEVETENIY